MNGFETSNTISGRVYRRSVWECRVDHSIQNGQVEGSVIEESEERVSKRSTLFPLQSIIFKSKKMYSAHNGSLILFRRVIIHYTLYSIKIGSKILQQYYYYIYKQLFYYIYKQLFYYNYLLIYSQSNLFFIIKCFGVSYDCVFGKRSLSAL